MDLNRKQINMLNKISGDMILVIKRDYSNRVYWINYKNHKPIKKKADYAIFSSLFSEDILQVDINNPIIDNEIEIIYNWRRIQDLGLEKYIR